MYYAEFTEATLDYSAFCPWSQRDVCSEKKDYVLNKIYLAGTRILYFVFFLIITRFNSHLKMDDFRLLRNNPRTEVSRLSNDPPFQSIIIVGLGYFRYRKI